MKKSVTQVGDETILHNYERKNTLRLLNINGSKQKVLDECKKSLSSKFDSR